MTESPSTHHATAVRCSDADREQTAARLRDAAAEGRLSMEELEERLGGVYAANYHHELNPLVTDMPRPPAPVATTGWWPILTAARAQLIGAGSGWTRRRLVLAAIVLLVLVGAVVAAFHGFGPGGFEHHGFEGAASAVGAGAAHDQACPVSASVACRAWRHAIRSVSRSGSFSRWRTYTRRGPSPSSLEPRRVVVPVRSRFWRCLVAVGVGVSSSVRFVDLVPDRGGILSVYRRSEGGVRMG